MVGPAESVQSLDKRDGSFLETFDCPNPDPSDYSVQTFKAVCIADSDDHDCEDLLLGDGAFGTIARLPADCGPDEWVRVVSFREINSTVPPTLSKRMTSFSKTYEIKYDYQIRAVANDEIFVRIDTSSHINYWDDVVASEIEGSKKRDDTNNNTRRDWREPHYEWFRRHQMRLEQDKLPAEKRGAGSLDWWRDLFKGFIAPGGSSVSGKKADYRFKQTLYQGRVSCPPNVDATVKATVAGGLIADLDWGVSLIGRVKDTEFEQAYAFFRLKSVAVNAQIAIEGSAQFTFESKEAQLCKSDPLSRPWTCYLP